jgi:hypothetical protein
MDVMALLGKIDLTAVVAASLSFLVGLAVIKPRLAKAVKVIGDISELLAEINRSLVDGKLSKEEVEAIMREGQELIAEFKK